MDHLLPKEARPSLADLVRINRRFGGHAAIRNTLRRVARLEDSFTLLDVGSASGDTARLIQELYPRGSVTSLDYNYVNLSGAPQPKLMADAFELPFGPRSFDFVLSSSFLHHFTDQEVTQLLAGFYAVAKRALLICDVERHLLPYLFLPASRLLFRWNRITVHDGIRSVRASFKARELLALTRAAGIEYTHVEVYRPAFRICLVAIKRLT